MDGAWSKDYGWINFEFDFRNLPSATWVALGECGSICEHIAKIPLAPDEWSEMHEVYLAKGVLATTAIEGNTLSEDEVRRAVAGTLEVPESKDYLKQEVENVIAAFNDIGRQIISESLPEVTPELLCEYNRKVLANLPLPDEVTPGEFRMHRVGVGRYRCPPAEHVPEMMRQLCASLKTFDENPQLDCVLSAILKAIVSHLYVVWIHPFGDGNGRTARLLEAMILLQRGVASPAAHLLSNHYNATRTEYYRVLEKSTKTGSILDFIAYAVVGLRDGLREQRKKLMDVVWKVVWKNHIYKTLGQKRQTAMTQRQRELALALAKTPAPVKLHDVQMLSPEIAMLYANKRSLATLRRDLLALLEDKLIKSEVLNHQVAYASNIECLSVLLPLQMKTNNSNR